MTFFEQANDDETHWSSECRTAISSPGTINLNSPLSQDDYYGIILVSNLAMLDSSEDIGLDLYQDQYSSNYSPELNVLYEDFYPEIQYEKYSHDELYETFISSESSDSSKIGKKLDKYAMERGFAVRKGRTRTREDGSVWRVFANGIAATTIRCSLIDDDSIHNHSMDPNIKNNAPRYHRLTEEMINKVELYYRCHVQPIKIIHLLENEYPNHPIKPRRGMSQKRYFILLQECEKKMFIVSKLQIIKPKSEQKYLTEFIKQIKQILQDPEQFEICDTKLDNINDQYYLIVDNNDPYPPEPLNLHVTEWIKTHINDTEYAQFEDELWIIEFVNILDESFTNSSREASRDSKESSISSSSCSNNTLILSSPCASSKSSSPCSNYEFEELVFVNLNADHFSKAGNTNSGIRPDGQLICK
ncbi:2056_t:CDS:2, partial [Gigaspora rosea]